MAPRYGEAPPEVFATIADQARHNGLFLDPVYTGKAFHGMLSELGKGDAGRLPGALKVVFVHTGGLFGLFPQQRHFTFGD
jgi:D-cysteine desulfhydrase